MGTHIWAVIPAYNEENRIGPVLKQVKKFCKNIIVVDDGSRDSTYDVARAHKCVTLRHVINLGKGAAVKTGCDYAIQQGANIIILLDSDGQHLPEDIPRFIHALEEVDIVFGYRPLNKSMPIIFRIGNYGLNLIIGLLTGLRLKDTQSGFRAMTADTYKKTRWRASDYTMESEMIANVARNKLSYREIPIKTIYSDRHKGTTILDGLKIGLDVGLLRLGLK